MNTTKQLSLVILLANCLLLTATGLAQNVGINGTGAVPNVVAGLDVDYTDKGLLIPRVTLCQRTTPSCADGMLDGSGNLLAAAQGLMVYQTDAGGYGEGFYYNISTTVTPNWVKFFGGPSSGGWALTGNSGTTAGTNFIGTTDSIDFAIFTDNTERMRVLAGGNVGIGTISPAQSLDVVGGAQFSNGEFDIYSHFNGFTTFMDLNTANDNYIQHWRLLTGDYTSGNDEGFKVQKFLSGSSATSYPFVIDTIDNVGIGEATPEARLHVSGGVGGVELIIEADINNGVSTEGDSSSIAR